MKSNELRQGNSIDTGVFHIESCRGIHKYENGWYKYIHLFNPVPITEEWLIEVGFEKLTDKKTGWKQSSYSLNNGRFIVDFDDGILTFDFHNMVKLKYRHQLENLYFSLEQKEI